MALTSTLPIGTITTGCAHCWHLRMGGPLLPLQDIKNGMVAAKCCKCDAAGAIHQGELLGRKGETKR